jgi:hypothetical protein
MNPPVFLGACAGRELKLVRAALAAHPRFFTSHLPADDEPSLHEWACAMRDTPCSRRPVWISQCAFDCMDSLRQELPGARFVRVVELPTAAGEDYLELDAGRLAVDPEAELARVFHFLGEQLPEGRAALRRCA